MADSESVDTHDTSNEASDDPLQDLTDEQLYQLLDDTVRANEVLDTETQMFEKYLKRVEPKDLAGIAGGAGATPSQSNQDLVRRVDRKRSKSRSSNIDKSLRLTAEQKCDIAQREIEELREEIDKLKEDSEKVLDTYKAIMEEADLRLAETKKESYEFDRDIMKGAINPSSNKVVAEKVVRYFEDRLRSRDTLIEKLRLKNSTLKVQKKKLHLQLKQKEEMGEVLHEVDFNQLKIENQQYLEKIDERNQDLLRLKHMTGNTLQVQNTHKKKLRTLTLESERLKLEISLRNDLLTRIEAETKVVEAERAKAATINKKLRQQLADYRVPEVMEYVSEKANLYELQKKVKSWERKVEIADVKCIGLNRDWIERVKNAGVPCKPIWKCYIMRTGLGFDTVIGGEKDTGMKMGKDLNAASSGETSIGFKIVKGLDTAIGRETDLSMKLGKNLGTVIGWETDIGMKMRKSLETAIGGENDMGIKIGEGLDTAISRETDMDGPEDSQKDLAANEIKSPDGEPVGSDDGSPLGDEQGTDEGAY